VVGGSNVVLSRGRFGRLRATCRREALAEAARYGAACSERSVVRSFSKHSEGLALGPELLPYEPGSVARWLCLGEREGLPGAGAC